MSALRPSRITGTARLWISRRWSNLPRRTPPIPEVASPARGHRLLVDYVPARSVHRAADLPTGALTGRSSSARGLLVSSGSLSLGAFGHLLVERCLLLRPLLPEYPAQLDVRLVVSRVRLQGALVLAHRVVRPSGHLGVEPHSEEGVGLVPLICIPCRIPSLTASLPLMDI
jgi:hypothetical protein